MVTSLVLRDALRRCQCATYREEEMGLQHKRVLVVEDTWLLATQVSALMQRAGATVCGPTGSAGGAMAMARYEELDGALLDVRLSDGTSAQVAEVLQSRGVPYVVISGYEKRLVPASMRQAPYLAKPIEAVALIDAVDRAFSHGRDPSIQAPTVAHQLAIRLCLELHALTGEAQVGVMLDCMPKRLRTSLSSVDGASR